MYDLGVLDPSKLADQGVVMEVRHPDTGAVLLDPDTDQPLTITLAGEDSARHRRAQHLISNRRLKQGISKIKVEELEASQLELLAECTLAWSGIGLDGETLTCSRSNALRVYERTRWLADQVSDFIKDRSHFLPPSVTPSLNASGGISN